MSRWTADDAVEAQSEWDAQNPSLPLGPVFWWATIGELKGQRARYEAGDDVALLDAVHRCAMDGLPMPAWCAQEYLNKYRSVIQYRNRSWDEAFGRAHKKGTNLAANEKKRRLSLRVWQEVRRIKSDEPDTPIDVKLFEGVGNKLSIGKTLAEEYYYHAKKRFDTAPS